MRFQLLLKSLGLLAVIAFTVMLCSCEQKEQKQLKFDKEQWEKLGDIEYPYRSRMISDLLKNHQLAGLNYKQLIDLLGRPNYANKDNTVQYDVIVDWGWGFSSTPIGGQRLDIILNSDSVVMFHKLVDWKHN